MKNIIIADQIKANFQPILHTQNTSKLSSKRINCSRKLMQQVQSISLRRKMNKKMLFDDMKILQIEPILDMAYRYGHKNQVNQIFEQFYRKSILSKSHSDSERQTVENSFQKLLEGQRKITNTQGHQKLSFMGYKTTYGQNKFKFLNKGKLVNNNKKSKSLSFTKDKSKNYPIQLQQLNNSLRLLPSVIKNIASTKSQNSIQSITDAKLSTWHTATIQKQSNCLLQNGEKSVNKPGDITMFSKTQGLCKFGGNKKRKDYQKDINTIIHNSQYMLNEQTKFKNDIQQQRNTVYIQSVKTNHVKPLLKVKPALYSKYWPQHHHYDLVKKHTNEVQRQNSKLYSGQVNDFLVFTKRVMQSNVLSLKSQSLQFQKESLDNRYAYRLSLQKESYKRNVKALLKCKKDFFNEMKRQAVRSNGIKRVSRRPVIVKMKKNKQIEELQ